ncbi:MAG: DNA-directed RNA polymerase subunit alpha [bacterium]
MKLKPFQMPKEIEIRDTDDRTYAEFVISPFERGFGTTLGNVFRRILLSSIHGVSITKIKFDKAYHEFSTLDGVKENVTDIILNFKKLRMKMDEDTDSKTVAIKISGPKEVTGADIEMPAGIEIINKDQYLFTITKKTDIKFEMNVEWGRGYLPAQYIEKDKTVGTIEIDAFFSPIKRVTTKVENTRVGQRTDYDKLIMEILTDGTISPKEALEEAVVILQGHIEVFNVKEQDLPKRMEESEDEDIVQMRNLINKRVTDLELSIRARNCLENNNIMTLADLVTKTKDEMLSYKNFGKQSLNQLEKKLNELGLEFNMDISPYIKSDNE